MEVLIYLAVLTCLLASGTIAAAAGPEVEHVGSAWDGTAATGPAVGARPAIKPHFLGAVAGATEQPTSGARVEKVLAGSPAEQAGLRPGDVITRLGPIAVRSARDLDTALRTLIPGQPVEVVLERDGKEVRTTATLIGRR